MPISPISLEAVFDFGTAPITYVGFANGSNLLFALAGHHRLIMLDPKRKVVVRDYQLPAAGNNFCSDWCVDRRHVAVGGIDGAKVFEVWGGQCIAKVPPHIPMVTRVAWSNSRRYIAIGECTIRIWNTATEKYDASFEEHSFAIHALRWSKDDRLLASADDRGLVIIWDVASGQPIARFNGMTNTVCDLAWSPDGRYLAIPTIFGRTPGFQGITVFDTGLGETVAEIETAWVTRLSFHPHGGPFGEFLATKGQDAVRLWKTGTWECVCVIPEERSNHIGEAIGFHPVSTFLCTLGNKGRAIRLWRYDPKALLDLTTPITVEIPEIETTTFTAPVSGVGPGHDAARFRELVRKVETAGPSNEKGDALEALCAEAFQTFDKFEVRKNVATTTEEIDLVIRNWSDLGWLKDHGFYVPVECKNWSTKCGAPELTVFKDKVRNRRGAASLGFLISWNGFAETVDLHALRGAPGDPIIALLTGDDLREIAEKGNLLDVLFRAYERAVMR